MLGLCRSLARWRAANHARDCPARAAVGRVESHHPRRQPASPAQPRPGRTPKRGQPREQRPFPPPRPPTGNPPPLDVDARRPPGRARFIANPRPLLTPHFDGAYVLDRAALRDRDRNARSGGRPLHDARRTSRTQIQARNAGRARSHPAAADPPRRRKPRPHAGAPPPPPFALPRCMLPLPSPRVSPRASPRRAAKPTLSLIPEIGSAFGPGVKRPAPSGTAPPPPRRRKNAPRLPPAGILAVPTGTTAGTSLTPCLGSVASKHVQFVWIPPP
jgi:hypothetical protein